jgi:CRP-like cAMP-binding protein
MNETIHNEFVMNLPKDPALSLDEKNAAILRGIFKPKSIRKDDFFLHNGEQSTEIGVILRGVFRSFYIDQNGNDVTKYFYPQGEFLLSYYAHLTQTESKYSIQALEDSEILVAHISKFEKVVEENYQLLLFYKKMVDAMLVKKEKHASSFTLLNNAQRYQQFLADYPGIEERIKQYQLASYLGMAPVTLSRIRNKLNLIKR